MRAQLVISVVPEESELNGREPFSITWEKPMDNAKDYEEYKKLGEEMAEYFWRRFAMDHLLGKQAYTLE